MEDKLDRMWEEKAIEHLPQKFRCAFGSLAKDNFCFQCSYFEMYQKGKTPHLELQKPSLLPDLKTDTRLVDTAYSSPRLYPKVGKTMMKYYENRMKTVE